MDVQSTKSSSTSRNSVNIRRIVNGDEHKIDLLFPIFDMIDQRVSFPRFLTSILSTFVYVQMLFTALWPSSKFYITNAPEMKKIINTWGWIAWFIPQDSSMTYYIICLACCSAIDLILVGLLLYVVIDYRKSRQSHRILLFIVDITMGYICILFQYPLAACIGIAFFNIVNGKVIYVLFIAIAAIMFGINSYLVYIYQFLESKSVIWRKVVVSMYDCTGMYVYLVISPASVIVMYFMDIYIDIGLEIVQIIHAIITVVVVYRLWFHQYHETLPNVLSIGILLASVTSDITMLILDYQTNTWEFVPIVVLFIAFVFWAIVATLMFRAKKNAVVNDLNNPDFDFSTLHLEKNTLLAEAYLRVGFMTASSRFIDFSLITYVAENVQQIIFSVLQLIAYFPSESRRLNLIFYKVIDLPKISFPDRYLIFQINKLNILRQASQSLTASEQISFIHQTSIELESKLRGIYLSKEITIRELEQLAITSDKDNLLFEDSLLHHPNNSKVHQEYTRFLTETRAEYVKAVRIQNMSDMIESGHNFAIDVSFKSMIRTFPIYLKKHVLDYNGNFIKVVEHKKSSSNNSMPNSSSSFSMNDDLEEQVGYQTLTSSKLRLAIDHALENNSLTVIKTLSIANFILLLFNIILFVAFAIIISQLFIDRKTSMDGTTMLSNMRFYLSLSLVSTVLDYASSTGRMNMDDVISGCSDYSFLHERDTYQESAIMQMMRSRKYHSEFINLLVDFAFDGKDIFEIGNIMIKNGSYLYTCLNGKPLDTYDSDLNTKLAKLYVRIAEVTIVTNFEAMIRGNNFCEVDRNYQSNIFESESLYTSLDDNQLDFANDLAKIIDILDVLAPVVIFFVNILTFILLFRKFFTDISKMINALLKIDQAVKDTASKRIMKGAEADEIEIEQTTPSIHLSRIGWTAIFIVLLSFGICFTIFAMIYNSDSVNDDILHMDYWQNYASQRLDYTVEAMYSIAMSIILNGTLELPYTTMSLKSKDALEKNADSLLMNSYLLDGSPNAPPGVGYDPRLDASNIQPRCDVGNSTNTHDMYRCASVSQALVYYTEMIREIGQHPERYEGRFADSQVMDMFHLAGSHMWLAMIETKNILVDLGYSAYDKLVTNSYIIMACGIAESLVLFFIVSFGIYMMKKVTTIVYVLIKRLPPNEIIHNKEIMIFIMNTRRDEVNKSMGLSQLALYSAPDPIIGVSLNGTAEFVNPALTKMFGYKPDQFLGQQPTVIFSEEEALRMSNHLGLMVQGQAESTFVDDFICLNDDLIEVPVKITAILFYEHGAPHSFIVVFQDQSEYVAKQREAENIKIKMENLLYQILPREIVGMLNNGEKDISFNIQKASILFIEINRFIDFATGMTPSELMGNLTQLYARFDEQLAKYSMLNKLKINGEGYIVASGLFTSSDENSAEQIIKFGLDCLMAIDDCNVLLNSNLSARAGIDTGGPLVAGVVGSEQPAFEIFGKPLSVANKLMTIDVPGKIMISQATFDHLAGLDFACEPYGEVGLKDGEKVMTYFVLPYSAFAIASFSTTH